MFSLTKVPEKCITQIVYSKKQRKLLYFLFQIKINQIILEMTDTKVGGTK